MEEDKKKQTIKLYIALTILALILILVAILMIRYSVEGETNMPFKLSKMVLISTAEGVEKEEQTDTKWNFSIFQNNDIYFSVEKNSTYSEKEDVVLDKVTIDNVEITKKPKVGNITKYMPNSTEGRLYSYSEDYLMQDKLEYKGAAKNDSKTLEVGNQGGIVYLRFSNNAIGDYASDEEEEVVHDGTLLSKVGIEQAEDISFSVSFDFTLSTKKNSYKAKIDLDLPCGNLLEEGTCTKEITNQKEFVFKRIK